MPGIYELLTCPSCGGAIDHTLTCAICNSAYEMTDGVINLVDERFSAGQWRWDARTFDESFKKKVDAEYEVFLNDDTKGAQAATWLAVENEIRELQGYVCDLATGLGSLFFRILRINDGVVPVATDVDPRVLQWTAHQARALSSKPFYAIATDGRRMAFRDQVFDVVTSYAGIENIPETPKVMKEVHRILKPGGQLIAVMHFLEPGSRSHMLAKELGVERASIAHLFFEDLRASGFDMVTSRVIASAVWAQNPQDLLPVAGDTQHWTIVKAVRSA